MSLITQGSRKCREQERCHGASAAMLQSSKRKVLCPVVQQGPAAVKPLGANFALDPAVVVLREVRGERPLSREGEQANAASEQALALVVKSHVQLE